MRQRRAERGDLPSEAEQAENDPRSFLAHAFYGEKAASHATLSPMTDPVRMLAMR